MSAVDEVIERNRDYAAEFTHADAPISRTCPLSC
jgi:hypothetical protein